MPQVMEFILNIALVIGFQIAVYAIFVRPRILTWGASQAEATMSLIGDDWAAGISSTRAISVGAPVSEVWKWIIQLGADRGGFFSYSLLEKLLGYEARRGEPIPEFEEMKVGRIVPGSIDEAKSLIKYNFRVVAVEPGKSFVLENWGAFVLREMDAGQTRLIVRTHATRQPGLKGRIADFLFASLHYIMERRMLMGIKAQVEGTRLSTASDNLWLLAALFSGMGVFVMLLSGHGSLIVFLSIVYGIAWLWTLLVLEPQPKYGLGLLLVEAMTMVVSAAFTGR